jgi:hypothetical protein
VLGKFLSVDPVIDTNLPQQNTGYTYAGNNPTTYTDPTGLRLDEGCGWATTCATATARGATSTPRPVKKPHLTPKPVQNWGTPFKTKTPAQLKADKQTYNTLVTVSQVSNYISLGTGAISAGLEVVALETAPEAPLAAGVHVASFVLGTASTVAAGVSWGADCIAHSWDPVCKGQAVPFFGSLMWYGVSLTRFGFGSSIGSTIFSVQQAAIWQMVPQDKRPKMYEDG